LERNCYKLASKPGDADLSFARAPVFAAGALEVPWMPALDRIKTVSKRDPFS
jgi:hypothetical protein